MWTVITSSVAAGMPAFFPVRLKPKVEGEFRLFRSILPFGLAFRSPETGPLAAKMEFARNWTDASFKVEIRPEQATTVEFI